MMSHNIDVQIYLHKCIKFFNDNPSTLKKLIGDLDPERFYDEIKKVSLDNYVNGVDITLTREQLLSIVRKLNNQPIQQTPYGTIYLN